MAINVFVQYNGGFLPAILLLTQAPIFVWFDGTIIVYYYNVSCYVWWTCIVIYIYLCVRYNGGLLPDIISILSTQGYYHRGTRLNTM